MQYTNDQKEVMRLFEKWYKNPDKQTLEIAGVAGVGKSTIIPEMIKRVGLDLEEEVLVTSYTGRAASNLTLKGIPASSMHSAFMESFQVPKLDENGEVVKKEGRVIYEWKLVKKSFLPKSIKLLIIDEGTFVDTFMGKIAESFNIPIYVTGDTEQLGPIYGKPYFLNNPDYYMTEITRQSKESGIIELATRIRLGKEIPNKKYRFKEDAFILPKSKITDTVLINSDIIICGRNKTRNYFNKRIREDILQIKSKLPVKGDKLICRHNYWNRVLGGVPLTNGIIGTVVHDVTMHDVDIKSNTVRIDFRPEYLEYDYYNDLPISIDYFQEECGKHDETEDRFRKGIKMELGYAITVHVSQGSQWPNVCVWDEAFPDEDFTRRLRYTAVTRATNLLAYFV